MPGRAASVFVYPLRARRRDQAFICRFARGDRIARSHSDRRDVTGFRDETFTGLTEGTVDVVLTTPEYLDHHASRFAEADRVRFVVIDEAHHVGLSRAGHRPAYAGSTGRSRRLVVRSSLP